MHRFPTTPLLLLQNGTVQLARRLYLERCDAAAQSFARMVGCNTLTGKMAVFNRALFQMAAVVSMMTLVISYFMIFHNYPGELTQEAPTTQKLRLPATSHLPPPGPCTCPSGSTLLKEHLPKDQYGELHQHKARTTSVLSRLLFASPNSPLQYPIQGFKVLPLTSTLIPGLALHAGRRSSYKVSLNVSKGVLTIEITADGVKVQGHGESRLIMESSSLVTLNYLLAKVSYTSTVYHIHTGDLASFQFENHDAVFPITIKQPLLPVLYDMGTDINSHVTVVTKTFLRYTQLKGWFAGRNLAVSQVTTKYLLWVDDDFMFTEETKIEKLVEVMEEVPELDVEGEEMDGGCLYRKSNGKFHPLPGYPQCSLASGVVNFFLARTHAVQRVGFDPKLQRVAHSEFFMDGLGSLLVASCDHVSIGHKPKTGHNKDEARYNKFRHPAGSDVELKLQLHFFKNHLKCIKYG